MLENIMDRTVYPVVLRCGGREFLTLYYDVNGGDAVLHDGAHFICFRDMGELNAFCADAGVAVFGEVLLYDFDLPLEGEIDYSSLLNNWNLLNTLAGTFGMYFEGDRKKYDGLYNLLFRLSTCAEQIAPKIRLCRAHARQLKRIFHRRERFLKRFVLY